MRQTLDLTNANSASTPGHSLEWYRYHDAAGLYQSADPAASVNPAAGPGLGSFSVPVKLPVTLGGQTYLFDAPAITFTPAGSEARRTISGVGAFTLVGPNPPPPIPPVPPVPPVPPIPIPPTPPPPIPGPTINVRDKGAKGDGVTIDRTVLNAAIQNAPAGAALYFPAGTYLLDDALKIFRSDLTLYGDGDASILKSVQGSYHVQVGSGAAYMGIAFHGLQFYGTPGQYMADGGSRGGLLLFGCKGTVIQNCTFTGCAEPVLNAGVPGSTAGTVVRACKFNGWGRMCIFCNGGELVEQCALIQDDPNLFGERSSHGVYIHGGASNVLIADCEFANIRKYCIQVYSESAPSVTDNVQILRCLFRDSANGVITAHGDINAGMLTNGLIEGNTFRGIYAGSSLAIKNGNGLIARGNLIDGNTGAQNGHSGSGCYLGVFAPYEPNFWLKDVTVTGNTITHCDRGIWTLPSNGGTFTDCVISGNHVTANRVNYDITGPGVIWTGG